MPVSCPHILGSTLTATGLVVPMSLPVSHWASGQVWERQRDMTWRKPPVSPAPVFSARRPSQPLTLKEESHPPWGQRAWELAVNAPPAHPHGDDVGDIVPTLSLVILSVSSQTAHTLCSGRPRRSLTDCPQEALRPTSGSDRDGPGPCCWDTAGPILEAARSINGGRLRQSRKDCFTRMAATRTQPGERQETRKGLERRC